MANEKNDPNSIWFAQRSPVRMSRDMLDNIESMMSSGHTPSEISRDMGLTPESVELGIEKVKARQREQSKSKRGGLFSTEARHARVRRTCDEIGCPWRSNGQLYCTLPSCWLMRLYFSQNASYTSRPGLPMTASTFGLTCSGATLSWPLMWYWHSSRRKSSDLSAMM